MPVVTGCPKCGQQYQVADSFLGQNVNCPQCGAVFVVRSPQVPPSGPAMPSAATPPWAQGYPPPTGWSPPGNPYASSATNIFEQGPTDRQIRLGGLVMIPLMILGMLAAAFGQKQMTTGGATLLGIGPFGLFYAIAALIDPNIVRAAGKYGKHLPARYKMIAGAIGVVALITGLTLSYLTWSRIAQ
ncbi:MAG: hypothetical protein U1A77_14215 [Pirellulales bacterium]